MLMQNTVVVVSASLVFRAKTEIMSEIEEYLKFYNLKPTILELVGYLAYKHSSGKYVKLVNNRIVWNE